jgi:hypothetical protein
MNTMNDIEMSEIEGGAIWLPGIGVYQAFLTKVENNPQDYTWMMDWYYQK